MYSVYTNVDELQGKDLNHLHGSLRPDNGGTKLLRNGGSGLATKL
jgi:hypothetical protein